MKIIAIFACYNRKEKTQKCIETIVAGNPLCEFTFVVVDDGSTDGTGDMLQHLCPKYEIHVVKGPGNWFYSGGMNAGMEYALQNLPHDFDYLLMMNDDVVFFEDSIQSMISQSITQENSIVAGATCNTDGKLSYGAVKYTSGYHYRKMDISEWRVPADTFNANCVLIPYPAFERTGVMDPFYRHSLGDFDYGLSLREQDFKIYPSQNYIGICNNNDETGTWRDTTLRRIERIKRKENVKGASTRQWFYFVRKHFGFLLAIKAVISSYLRIILGW